MPHDEGARLVLIGRILKAHGIQGEVIIAATGGDPDRLRPGTVVRGEVAAKRGERGPRDGIRVGPWTVATARWTGDGWIARFAGCDDRNAAEALAGVRLSVEAADLPPLPDGEYYRFQLEGLRVTGPDGAELGRLAGVIELPGQDLFEVTGPGGMVLVPGRREFIEWIDLEKGELRLKDRADLLEAQQAGSGLPRVPGRETSPRRPRRRVRPAPGRGESNSGSAS